MDARLQNIGNAGEIVAVNATASAFPPVTAAAVPAGWSSGRGIVPGIIVDLGAAGAASITDALLYAAFLETGVVADTTFTTATTDICTAAGHGLITGDGPIRVSSSGTLPAGLVAATDYYVIWVSANTFKLATSRANAFAGTAVDITDTGSGTHTLSDTSSTKSVKWRRWGIIASAPTLSLREGVAQPADHDPRVVAYGVTWTGTAANAVRAAICARGPA